MPVEYSPKSSINVSTLLKLSNLSINDCNPNSLDVSHNTELKRLSGARNKISDTNALEAWLAEEGHSSAVLP